MSAGALWKTSHGGGRSLRESIGSADTLALLVAMQFVRLLGGGAHEYLQLQVRRTFLQHMKTMSEDIVTSGHNIDIITDYL